MKIIAPRNRKVAGADDISGELHRSTLENRLHLLMVKIWNEEVVPRREVNTLRVALFKEGNRKGEQGIKILSAAS